jgi:GT2 family glycosyltransferase
VQFLDGDCELEKDWLDGALAYLEGNPDVAVACGRRRERFKTASLYNAWMDDEWNTPVGPAAACGGDALMRISAIGEVGGYDDSIVAGEEPELCGRLRNAGWKLYRLDLPMSVHDANMHRFGQWWRRAVRSGYGYAQVRCKTQSYRSGALYTRELVRAFAWSFGVAVAAVVLALLFSPIGLLFAIAVWGVQFLRLSRRHGARKAVHFMLGKWAEAFGAMRYAAAALLKREKGAILYK